MSRFPAFPFAASLCLGVMGWGHAAAAPAPDVEVTLFGELSGPSISLTIDEERETIPLYETNSEMTTGVGLRYGAYSVSLGSPFFGASRRDPYRPVTRFFDMRLAWLDDRWGVEAYHQYFRGFVLTDSERKWVLYGEPGMTLGSQNVNVYRAVGGFSRVARMRDGISRTGFQPNLYLVGSLSRQSMRLGRPVLDSMEVVRGSPFEGMRRLEYTGGTGGLGLTVNTNLSGFYLDPTVMVGFGLQHRESDVPVSAWGLQIKVNIKLQAGFETDSFKIGMSAENDLNSVELSEVDGVAFHSVVVRLFTGVKF